MTAVFACATEYSTSTLPDLETIEWELIQPPRLLGIVDRVKLAELLCDTYTNDLPEPEY